MFKLFINIIIQERIKLTHTHTHTHTYTHTHTHTCSQKCTIIPKL